MAQLPLPLTLPELFSEDNFFVSDCNGEAYNTVLGNWQNHALYLYGEKSSGKSHLAHIWQKRMGAAVMSSNNIDIQSVNGNCLVEDIENCTDEQSLFHLYNHCKEIKAKLLMTSSVLPGNLPFKLPDLTSRLRSCQLVTLYPPDDILIASVIRKQFSDRQLLVDDEVVSYVSARCERTLEGVKNLVQTLDKNALAEQRNITIPFVKKVAAL